MKVLRCEQGSVEWKEARLGIPTASRFDKIITPAKRQYSAGARKLIYECLAERMLGYPLDDIDTFWMERGRELEPHAIRYYEFQRDVEVERVGCVLLDDGSAGASPDGLIGDVGGIEIKCPSPQVHMGHLLGHTDPATETQVQGGLWIAEREWWDVLSYHPNLPPVLLRVYRDEDFIRDLAAGVERFTEELAEAQERLDAMGEAGRIEIMNAIEEAA